MQLAPNVNILGTNYRIILERETDNPKLEGALGYCEPYSKKLVVYDYTPDELTAEAPETNKMATLRHEIIHAFLHESGLSDSSYWAMEEEMIDWFALQAPKIFEAMMDVGAL